MNREQALQKACFLLREQAKEESLAKFLLMYILEEDLVEFNSNYYKVLDTELRDRYFDLIAEHIKTEKPLSHLVGFDYFYGRKYFVTNAVLSPRMETEELVYKVINYVRTNKLRNIKLLDLCTGSGVIGITIKKELEDIGVEVICSDISSEALKVAQKNADINKAKIKLVESDLFTNIEEKFDIIVSNPPYIPYKDKETLSKNVLNYDPHLALFAEEEGMYFYRLILENAGRYLKNEGKVFFEIGYDQKEKIEYLANKNGYLVEVTKDINGKDRMVELHITKE